MPVNYENRGEYGLLKLNGEIDMFSVEDIRHEVAEVLDSQAPTGYSWTAPV